VLVAILGPGSKPLIDSGDPVEDREGIDHAQVGVLQIEHARVLNVAVHRVAQAAGVLDDDIDLRLVYGDLGHHLLDDLSALGLVGFLRLRREKLVVLTDEKKDITERRFCSQLITENLPHQAHIDPRDIQGEPGVIIGSVIEKDQKMGKDKKISLRC
jgi:hypothetical protein